MPGYILHLTSARMALDAMEKRSGIRLSDSYKNEFFLGSLLPDTVEDKALSHFRNSRHFGEMVEYPDLKLFLKKYSALLEIPSCLGYYFHLYIDRRFFKEYLPGVITFLDDQGKQVTKRDEVVWVQINRTGQKILWQEFFSEAYYYGDYTRMNTYLAKRYDLLFEPDIDVENPGMEEVEFADVAKVWKELHRYMDVPAEEVEKVRVFEVEKLLSFLEEAVIAFCGQI